MQPSYLQRVPAGLVDTQQPVSLPTMHGQRLEQGGCPDVATSFMPQTTFSQNHAVELMAVSGPMPEPDHSSVDEETDLLGLALLPPAGPQVILPPDPRTTVDMYAKRTDSCTAADNVALGDKSSSCQRCKSTILGDVGGTAVADSATACIPGVGPTTLLSPSKRKKLVYIDLPSKSIFSRAILY